MADDNYYSIKDVAKKLKVVYITVYRWIQSENLHAYKAGKQYRIKSIDLDSFVKSYKRK